MANHELCIDLLTSDDLIEQQEKHDVLPSTQLMKAVAIFNAISATKRIGGRGAAEGNLSIL